MTTRLRCRLLPHETRGGPANMALDQALLDAADADPKAAVFRTYTWTEPTLSLGYFQHHEDVAADRRWDGLAVVRRPSGGGALLHDQELTYALIIPRTHPLAVRPSALYRTVHAAIAERLNALGVPAQRRGETDRSASDRRRPFLCFLDQDPEDLLIAGSKIVGSAQRRRPDAVLQHGSILARRSVATPELPGLAELTPWSGSLDRLAAALGEALPLVLDLEPVSDTATENERNLATILEDGVYLNPSWTLKR